MEHLLKEILKKVDEVHTRIHTMEINQVEVKKDLKYHIKRTDILEAKVLPIWKVYTAVVILTPLVGGAILLKDKIVLLLGL